MIVFVFDCDLDCCYTSLFVVIFVLIYQHIAAAAIYDDENIIDDYE